MTNKQPASIAEEMRALAAASRDAARELARASTAAKNTALLAAADAVKRRARATLAANQRDLAAARKAGQNAAYLDRLALDAKRLDKIAASLAEVARLPDPVGEVTASWARPNGLTVKKVRIPLGVVLMVYEARPDVTVEAAGLCLKSGNAAILRGGSEAAHANAVVADAVEDALAAAGLPARGVQLVRDPSRELLAELLAQDRFIDLCIPRGGQGLMRFVRERARVPVVPHA